MKPAQQTSPIESCKWPPALQGVVLFVLVCLAYLPALQGLFIWDDDYNVLKSAPLRSFAGLLQIWFNPGLTQQYYPLTHTSFWLDYHFWVLNPLPYHAENILLHALGAVLIWRLLLRLKIPGAWLGAAIFGLHPVCVESVAWITERKNTLCLPFFLGSLWAAIEFWLPGGNLHGSKELKPTFGRWKFYWLTLFLYLCALWSKTAAVGLPAVILVLVWWKRGRVGLRDALLLLPLLAIGFTLGLITLSVETKLVLIGATGEAWRLMPLERSLIAARALWFYVGKLCWPHPLMFMYPRWNLDPASLPGCAALIGGGAGFLALWLNRDRWGRPILVAAAYFIIMLFPLLGFFNGVFFRYSFVCDHFQYLASIGPLALLAAGVTLLLRPLATLRPRIAPALCAALLLTLAGLSWKQARIYHSLETLWGDSIAHNPNSWMAHVNLANYLIQSGRAAEAEPHYQKALELHPNDYVVYYNWGLKCATQGDVDQAVAYFNKTLKLSPEYAPAHYNLGNVLVRKGDLDSAIREYGKALDSDSSLTLAHFNLANVLARKGSLDEAIHEYEKASHLDPDFAAVPFSLANILVKQGKLPEAKAAYQRALEIQPAYAAAYVGLGRVFASEKRLDEAILHYRKALEIEPNSVEALVNLGNALVNQNQCDEAIALYRTALRLDSKSPVIHHNLAAALSRLGRTTEALDELSKANQLETAQPASP
jgi:tetratricopeptide (TPR) repeat protein